MPRPQNKRTIRFNPEITYFKPVGVPLRFLEEIVITLDELEAIRLKDLEGMDQEEASKKMNISRITFQRILKSCYRKISEALIMGKSIKMKGGIVTMPRPRRGMGQGMGRGQAVGGGTCVCPKCGKEYTHNRGIPCVQQECDECKVALRGEFCR